MVYLKSSYLNIFKELNGAYSISNQTEEMKMKKFVYRFEERSLRIPNFMHLDTCIQGGNIYKNKNKYSRKGKSKFDYRKELLQY